MSNYLLPDWLTPATSITFYRSGDCVFNTKFPQLIIWEGQNVNGVLTCVLRYRIIYNKFNLLWNLQSTLTFARLRIEMQKYYHRNYITIKEIGILSLKLFIYKLLILQKWLFEFLKHFINVPSGISRQRIVFIS